MWLRRGLGEQGRHPTCTAHVLTRCLTKCSEMSSAHPCVPIIETICAHGDNFSPANARRRPGAPRIAGIRWCDDSAMAHSDARRHTAPTPSDRHAILVAALRPTRGHTRSLRRTDRTELVAGRRARGAGTLRRRAGRAGPSAWNRRSVVVVRREHRGLPSPSVGRTSRRRRPGRTCSRRGGVAANRLREHCRCTVRRRHGVGGRCARAGPSRGVRVAPRPMRSRSRRCRIGSGGEGLRATADPSRMGRGRIRSRGRRLHPCAQPGGPRSGTCGRIRIDPALREVGPRAVGLSDRTADHGPAMDLAADVLARAEEHGLIPLQWAAAMLLDGLGAGRDAGRVRDDDAAPGRDLDAGRVRDFCATVIRGHGGRFVTSSAC